VNRVVVGLAWLSVLAGSVAWSLLGVWGLWLVTLLFVVPSLASVAWALEPTVTA
jgi:hypothetical protein